VFKVERNFIIAESAYCKFVSRAMDKAKALALELAMRYLQSNVLSLILHSFLQIGMHY
jgi:hypothetical protein